MGTMGAGGGVAGTAGVIVPARATGAMGVCRSYGNCGAVGPAGGIAQIMTS